MKHLMMKVWRNVRLSAHLWLRYDILINDDVKAPPKRGLLLYKFKKIVSDCSCAGASALVLSFIVLDEAAVVVF